MRKTIKKATIHSLFLLFTLCLSAAMLSGCSDGDGDGNENNNGENNNGNGDGDEEKPVVPILTITPKVENINFSAEGTEIYEYSINTNQESWEVNLSPANAVWCIAKKTADGKGFVITAKKNTGESQSEKITVTVSAGKAEAIVFYATQSLYIPTMYIAGYEYDYSKERYIAYSWINEQETTLGSNDARAHSIYVDGKDVYVTGDEGVDACYWRNGKKTVLGNGSKMSMARAVFAVDNNVYAVGAEYDNEGNSIACCWVNGKKTVLGVDDSEAYSVFVSGKDVYFSGYEYNGKRHVACYWKNGKKISLGSDRSSADYILVEGSDIYVVGNKYVGENTVACYWKNGVETTLGAENSYAHSMVLNGKDIYVVGKDQDVACYWKNGTKALVGAKDSEAYSMSIFGGDIYVAGDEYYLKNYVACYWKNGVKSMLKGEANISGLRSISVQ